MELNCFPGVLPDIVNDVFCRGTRLKDFSNTQRFQFCDVVVRDDPANDDQHVTETFLLHEFHDAWAECHMCARKHGQSYNVGIFLKRCVNDLFGSLAEAGVNDFETGVAESAGNDFSAAIVPVEAWLRDQYA